jgi:thiol-disulfide isomerase/thioredoxin
MSARLTGFTVALALFGPFTGITSALTIGDTAPPLTVSKWLKGERVDKLDAGQVYVLEFWATWCEPCKATIPRLTELQQKYKGATFIGVSIWENDLDAVAPFVKSMGDKMDYRVAADDVPPISPRREGKMSEAWMNAAGEHSIPTAFIVDKENKIAWIGHPMEVDEPLGKVLAGTWDIKAAASQRNEITAERTAANAALQKLTPLMRNKVKNNKQIVEILNETIPKVPSVANILSVLKYEVLLYGEDGEPAASFGTKLVENTFKDNVRSLDALATLILDPKLNVDAGRRDVKLAFRAAHRAYELTDGKNFAVLDTLAQATFLMGDAAKAADFEERAIKLAPKPIPDYAKRLEKFREAAKSK